MADSWASSPAVRATMRGNRRRDTGPELALRRELHRLGLRYRVDQLLPLDGVRRRADVTFPRRRLAVFVDGCWWHGCPEHCNVARTNEGYWTGKIGGNAARDLDTDRRLAEAGWESLRVWEHEDPAAAARRVLAAVRTVAKP